MKKSKSKNKTSFKCALCLTNKCKLANNSRQMKNRRKRKIFIMNKMKALIFNTPKIMMMMKMKMNRCLLIKNPITIAIIHHLIKIILILEKFQIDMVQVLLNNNHKMKINHQNKMKLKKTKTQMKIIIITIMIKIIIIINITIIIMKTLTNYIKTIIIPHNSNILKI